MGNNMSMKKNFSLVRALCLTSLVFMMSVLQIEAQVFNGFKLEGRYGLKVDSLVFSDSTIKALPEARPLFSFMLNDRHFTSGNIIAAEKDNVFYQNYYNGLYVTTTIKSLKDKGVSGEILFENRGGDTVKLSNVVLFGESDSSVYITGYGPSGLARACLFRPGYRPLRVILPDNAWEMGYCSFRAGDNISLCGIARRTYISGGKRSRYSTVLPPNTRVTYTIHADIFRGAWQNGLRLMFRDRYLYDLDKFDNTLYERSDLAWIKSAYIIVLQMAWDKDFYDRLSGKYNYPEVIRNGLSKFGKIDVYGIWPTWPRLGLDQRNQWDMYGDLPGGIHQLRNFIQMSKLTGTRFFIAYNPWDNSTRQENHYRGMAKLIEETDADGVVLDTRGSSSHELQAAADSVKKGVIMFSEGMAVPSDMPGIISGRVHNAIYMSPELNLNKLIKPDFSIFRVCDVGEDVIHRELAIAFFNGYGSELNMFRPGRRDDDYRKDMDLLAHTTFILRQNNDAFLDKDWTPLIRTKVDNVFVNRWSSGKKKIYTVLNMRQEGYSGILFRVADTSGRHFVSLWNHKELKPARSGNDFYVRAEAEGWNSSYTGTRKEGSVDCIGEFPRLIKSDLKGDSLTIKLDNAGKVLIYKGEPSYQSEFKEYENVRDTTLSIKSLFGYYEGKIVIQLVKDNILKDERVHVLLGDEPWIISKLTRTARSVDIPDNMELVPAASLLLHLESNDDFIPYPNLGNDSIRVDSFLIDRFPVTNAQYYEFLSQSGYWPADTSRYLRNWQNGMYRQGQEDYPVVYLSYEDMQAYAKWAGKRLPTQAEWQLAAQGTDNRKWPWGNEFHGTYCNNSFDRPTPVDAFMKGQSPYGVADLVGNVWQMTNDMYFNGNYYFTIIRGGSYFKPESSWWYIQGGPQPLDKTQMMLLVSPGFDRSATVGFRCVRDVDAAGMRGRR
jgi:iron(II)-dependent oxidoreductase